MIQDFIVHHAKLLVAILVITFLLLKFALIRMYGLREEVFRLFQLTLGFMSKVVVDNTYFEDLQKYYKVSNRVNLFFYLAIILVIVSYVVLKFFLRSHM